MQLMLSGRECLETLTLLKDNLPLKIFLLVMIILAGLAHFYLMPPSGEKEKTIVNAPRHFVSRERAAHYPPAFSFCNDGNIHYLGRKDSQEIKYLIYDHKFNLSSQVSFELEEISEVEYIFSVGFQGNQTYFVVVSREGRAYQPYLLANVQGEKTMKKLPFSIQQSKDIAGILVDGLPILVFVTREEGEYYLKAYHGGEKNLIFSSENFLGLPRLTFDGDKEIYLLWKGTRGAIGVAQHQIYDLEDKRVVFDYPKELGSVSIYFGEVGGQPKLFQEDPGGNLIFDGDGDLFVTWTDAFWEPLLGVFESKVKLLKMSSRGEILERWTFSGRTNFSAFGELFLDQKEDVNILLEDYSAGRFDLLLSSYSPELEYFSSPERFTPFFGNHRLVSVEKGPDGEFVTFWKTMDGREDEIWARTSREMAPPGWSQRLQLWFVQDGLGSIFLETAMISLFSLIAAVATLARNGLAIALIAVLLYILQSHRILGRINFFLFCGLLLGIIISLREFLPLFYSTPASSAGLQLFSALISTLLVIMVARKQWFKGGEEFVYLGYTVLWIFLDSFILLLAITPGTFSP